ncbi:MAG: M20 family metallo-hydrolase [Verrucomicrobium sp.]|nr:M20 family metallo-hydrolase [Verrucomicrobium sp.]
MSPAPALSLDAARLQAEIDELAAISEAPAPVVTRVLYSEKDLAARAWLAGRCRALGLELRTDAVGNTFAHWEGTEPGLPAVATGSHIDAIPNAGRYDGVVGVLGALEAFRALRASGFAPRRAIELVVFAAEEPTRFGLGCLGSRMLSGALSPEKAAALRDSGGVTLAQWREGLAAAGYSWAAAPLASAALPRGCYHAFVELHIEQGPILEKEGLDLAVVEKIAAPAAFRYRLTGEGGHAGAVLMPGRHDALLAGAEIALAAEKAAKESGSPDTVATTGVFQIGPNAINSIPASALLEIDLRDTDVAVRERTLRAIEAAAEEACKRRGVTFLEEPINLDPPALCDAGLRDDLLRLAREAGLKAVPLVSHAYHDTLFMALLCPVTMLFVPSRGGVSHRPDEYTSPEETARGAAVLAAALREWAS